MKKFLQNDYFKQYKLSIIIFLMGLLGQYFVFHNFGTGSKRIFIKMSSISVFSSIVIILSMIDKNSEGKLRYDDNLDKQKYTKWLCARLDLFYVSTGFIAALTSVIFFLEKNLNYSIVSDLSDYIKPILIVPFSFRVAKSIIDYKENSLPHESKKNKTHIW